MTCKILPEKNRTDLLDHPFTVGQVTRALSLGVVFFILGCSNDPYRLSLNSPSGEQPAPSYRGKCNVTINPVIDERSSTDNLGKISPHPVYANDSLAWIENSLFKLKSPAQSLQEEIILNTSLKKLYVSTNSTLRIGHLVLAVDYLKGDHQTSRIYRGEEQDFNWSSTEDEAKNSLESALKNVIETIEKDITSLCESFPVSSS